MQQNELGAFDPEAEHSILGMALKFPAQAADFRSLGLKPEHFRNPDLGEIWRRVGNTDNGHPLIPEDLADLADALRNAVPGEMALRDSVSNLIRRNRNHHLIESVESLYNKLSRGDPDDASIRAHADLIAAEASRLSGDKASHSEVAFDIDDLLNVPVEEEREKRTLLGHSFLDAKAGMIVVGSTGSGKSVFGTQASVNWCQGKAYLGIKSAKPFKILIVQAEDGELDLAEMLQGAFKPQNEQNLALVRENLRIVKLNGCTNEALMARLSEIHQEFRFELAMLNPVFSFAKGDLKDAETVQHFCRNLLDPFIEKHACSIILVAHPPKPTKTREGTVVQDTEYSIYGSAEWSNWARATLQIVATTTPDVYKLVAGKRRKRVGWVDGDGRTLTEILIKHGEDDLEWLPAESGDLLDSDSSDSSVGRKPKVPDFAIVQALRSGDLTVEGLMETVTDLMDLGTCPITRASLRKRLSRMSPRVVKEGEFYHLARP